MIPLSCFIVSCASMAHMVLPYCSNNLIVLFPQNKISFRSSILSPANAQSLSKRKVIKSSQELNIQNENMEDSIARIKKMFGKVELSASSYDTAWVSMVPSRDSPCRPCFPQCLEWLLENQHPNGCWGLNPSHPLLLKDSLSCTLASILALQKWGLAEQLVQKGLDFIGTQRYGIGDKNQSCPIGFDIVFPEMICQAQKLGLNLPFDSRTVDVMVRNRDLEVGRKLRGPLAYVAEGLGESCHWEDVMIHQRSNGSLFNSPATTAAAAIHLRDGKSLEYLEHILNVNGDTVSSTYPFDLSIRLSLVDSLEKLGINRFFRNEIESVLNETYRCWQSHDEDMFLDVGFCSMAFRLLRMNGYQVSSDGLVEFSDEEHFFNTVSIQFKDTKTILELYKAGQTTIFEKEPILEEINRWTRSFLKHQLLNEMIFDENLRKEVDFALKYFHSSVDILDHRRNMELYNVDDFQMLKTSYRCSNIDKTDILVLSLQDFNNRLAIYTDELQKHETWVKDNKLDQLKLEWYTLPSCHFQVASVLFPPELSDSRSTWVKSGVIGTILDDMFEIDGSREELLNIIELVEKWDEHATIGYVSKRTEILFLAIYDMINEFSSIALIKQGRCIKHHLIEMQLDFLKSELQEVEVAMANSKPTLDEYMSTGIGTSGVSLYCMNIFFLGPVVSEAILRSEEYNDLFSLAGKVSRTLNDFQSDEREKTQRKVNTCVLLANEGLTHEEARKKVRQIAQSSRRKLLRLTLEKEGSIVPKAVKESLWKFSKIMHYLFTSSDEFRRPGNLFEDIEVVYKSVTLSQQLSGSKFYNINGRGA